MKIFYLLVHVALVLSLGYYLITVLQWNNYRVKRVVLNFKKPLWHLFFFVVPVFVYYLAYTYAWIYIFFALLPSLYMWHRKIDKKLVFTSRVKRFFLFLVFATLFQDLLCLVATQCQFFGLLMPLVASVVVSELYEKILFNGFVKSAKKKLSSIEGLKVVAITASYGKTSIKNFLFEILSTKYNCYKTPRSVNTLSGLVQDVNNSLPSYTKVYIAEAGAREQGDINEIAQFLEPEVCVVGQVGAQHLEFFKSVENIRNTKMELISSPKMKKSFVHVSANINNQNDDRIVNFGDELQSVEATLEGTKFSALIDGEVHEFETELLGEFNATNLLVCVHVALFLGLKMEQIKKAISNLKSVEHRLSKMIAGGKIILDDSFNGNFEGMSGSYKLASTYSGRKVVVTPGIVESTVSENEKLAKIINEVFDFVIITGSVNAQVLSQNIDPDKFIVLKDKTKLQDALVEYTRAGDLVLFSNDAPSFF